ncbi:MAG: hypothetical protein ACKOA9_02995 [Actinomycetota bacterium]
MSSDWSTGLLVLHAFGASFMAGLGWFVQIVHYPLFAFVDRDQWDEYHSEHSRRTAGVVAVPWAIQGFTALALVAARPAGVSVVLIGIAVVLAGVTVAATVAFALPAHASLARAFDPDVHRRLVRTNWVRTVAWTSAVMVAAVMLVQYVAAC